MNNRPQNKRGGQTKYTRCSIIVITTIFAIIALLSFGISYAYFTASKQVDGVSFLFKKDKGRSS